MARKTSIFTFIPVSIAVLGLAFSLTTYHSLVKEQENIISQKFNFEAARDLVTLEGKLEVTLQNLARVGDLFVSAGTVSDHSFATFVKPIMKSYPYLQAVEWVPRVKHSERTQKEHEARSVFSPNFTFTEKRQGKMVTAGERDLYYPVFYVHPFEANKSAHGFDLGSSIIRLKSLEQARDTGKPVATAKISLVQEKQNHPGFLIFHPVYSKSSPDLFSRRKNLRGFSIGVYRVSDMMNALVLPYLRSGMTVTVYDGEAKAENLLFSNLEQSAVMSAPHLTSVAGRKWTIIWHADSTFYGGISLVIPTISS